MRSIAVHARTTKARATWTRRPGVFSLLVGLFALLVSAASACGDDEGPGTKPRRDGSVASGDVLIALDGRDRDLSAAPDLPTNQEGPRIEIQLPALDQIVTGGVLRVAAKVSDNDGIDAQTVAVTLQEEDAQPVAMGLSATPEVYEAQLDVRQISGRARLWVVASDLLGNANSAIREFRRDPGPVIRFVSPDEESRHKSSVSLEVAVADTYPVTSFGVRLGSQNLTLKELSRQGNTARFAATIAFDDPQFGAPLAGKQVFTAEATNQNGARTVETRTFFVDVDGPEIAILSHQPGDLIGSVIEVRAQVKDPAGVNAPTVQCIIGNELQKRTVLLRQDAADPSVFAGQFDTATLTDEQLWPVMSFRAEDTLGNRNHKDIEVGLDNGPPVLSLDPPENFASRRERDQRFECSLPYDPLGADAVDDLDEVAQTPDVRVRIEDDGNFVPGAWLPIAGVDASSVWVYFLPQMTSSSPSQPAVRPIVVDTDDDGWCDAINPEVVPRGSPPQPGEAVAVNLSPITPVGSANFTPYSLPDEYKSACHSSGTDDKPPDTLCDTTPLTIAIHYLVSKQAAIWSIPPVVGGDALRCLGLPFDFSNEIPDGWTCVAAAARDQLGNQGVAKPIRVWWNSQQRPTSTRPAPGGVPTPPNCTGTLDKASGRVNNTPCNFRAPFGSNQTQGVKFCTRDDECCTPNGAKGCGRYVGRCLTDDEGQRVCRAKWPQVFYEWEVRDI